MLFDFLIFLEIDIFKYLFISFAICGLLFCIKSLVRGRI